MIYNKDSIANRNNKVSIWDKIRSKISLARIDNSLIVRLMVPPKGSEGYRRTKKKIKRAGISKSCERLATYRVLIMVFSFIVIIGMNLYYISSKQDEIIKGIGKPGGTTTDLFGGSGVTDIKNKDTIQLLVDETVRLNPKYKRLAKKHKYNDIISSIKKAEDNLGVYDTTGDITKAVLTRIVSINDYSIKPLYILVYVLLSFLLSSIVSVYISIKKTIQDIRIDKEFKLMEIVTVMLVKNSNLSVEQLLNIHREHSNILLEPLNRCLAEYPTNKTAAIDNLIEEVDNEDFSTFMTLIKDNLVSDSATNIKLLEAQKSLNYVLDIEKYTAKVNKYSLIYTLLGFPIWVLALTSLLLPVLLYVSKSF